MKKIEKIIIIGAGLGGLTHGILLKSANPDINVEIYDMNSYPGGFCFSFKKSTMHENEKVTYTINLPVVTTDFEDEGRLGLFLKFLGIKNIRWEHIKFPFAYYSPDEKPFIYSHDKISDIVDLFPADEKSKAVDLFSEMQRIFHDVLNKIRLNPTPVQAIKMLFTMPETMLFLIKNRTYHKHIQKKGIKTPYLQDMLCIAESFMGVEPERASALAEIVTIQSLLTSNPMQPAMGDNFQTLSKRFADRFIELGGKIYLNSKVDSVVFNKNKAEGIRINGRVEKSDAVILAVAQDKIKELIQEGKSISKIKKTISNIDKIGFANTDYYAYYLIDKKVVDKEPRLLDVSSHIYRRYNKTTGKHWNLNMFIPKELINDKYYLMSLFYVEKDQDAINQWIDQKTNNYPLYEEKKKIIDDMLLSEFIDSEPIFKEIPPLKKLISISPASYEPYGSKYPINGLAQTPMNFGLTRMQPVLLDNCFISGGASFSAGIWGALAGGWSSFTASYKKLFGIKIGDNSLMFKPGMKGCDFTSSRN